MRLEFTARQRELRRKLFVVTRRDRLLVGVDALVTVACFGGVRALSEFERELQQE